MYPITPHFCEIAYLDYFLPHVDATKFPKYLSEYEYSIIEANQIDFDCIKINEYLQDFMR